MKCVLCREQIDIEHPETVYDRNPSTFRMAWMHRFCFQVALEDLKHEKPSKNVYQSRLDEYLTRFA
jgi:hypothetical protein